MRLLLILYTKKLKPKCSKYNNSNIKLVVLIGHTATCETHIKIARDHQIKASHP